MPTVTLPYDFNNVGRPEALARIHAREKREDPLYGPIHAFLEAYLQPPGGHEDVFAHTYAQHAMCAVWPDSRTDPASEESDAEEPDDLASSADELDLIPREKPARREIARTVPSSTNTRETKKRVSVRTPDFVQRWYFVKDGERGKKICDPNGPVMVMVEAKRHGLVGPGERAENTLFKTREQTDEQANHVFAAWPALKVLGIIRVYGYAWTYSEVKREDLQPKRSASVEADPTFDPSKRNPKKPSKIPETVPKWFLDHVKHKRGQVKMLHLLDELSWSKAALCDIARHIYMEKEQRVDLTQ